MGIPSDVKRAKSKFDGLYPDVFMNIKKEISSNPEKIDTSNKRIICCVLAAINFFVVGVSSIPFFAKRSYVKANVLLTVSFIGEAACFFLARYFLNLRKQFEVNELQNRNNDENVAYIKYQSKATDYLTPFEHKKLFDLFKKYPVVSFVKPTPKATWNHVTCQWES